MSSAPYLKRADNGVYYVHWTDNRIGKRVSTREKDLANAKAFFAQWMLMERSAPMDGTQVTVGDCWRVYDEKHVQPNVVDKRHAAHCWKCLKPDFADVAVSTLSQEAIDRYMAKRTRTVKPVTVRNELSFLSAAITFCSRRPNKLIEPGVAAAAVAEITLPPQSEPRERWLRISEIQALLHAAAGLRRDDRLSRGERFLWLALETAARCAAILDLTWDRVDFEAGVIDFNVPGRKRTKKRRSVVPISTALRPVLERAYRERQGELVVDNKADIWRTVQTIAVRAGVAPDKRSGNGQRTATGVSPHVLRHTAATHMARRGVPLLTIARILGNTAEMVERVYAKWQPAEARAAVDLISNNELEPIE